MVDSGRWTEGYRGAGVELAAVRFPPHDLWRRGAWAMSSVSVVIPCYKYGHFLRNARRQRPGSTSGRRRRPRAHHRRRVARRQRADSPRHRRRGFPSRGRRPPGATKGNIATYNEGLLEWAAGDYPPCSCPPTIASRQEPWDGPGTCWTRTPEVGFVYGCSLWVHGRRGAAATSHDGARLVGVARPVVDRASVPPGGEPHHVAGNYRSHVAAKACGRLRSAIAARGRHGDVHAARGARRRGLRSRGGPGLLPGSRAKTPEQGRERPR